MPQLLQITDRGSSTQMAALRRFLPTPVAERASRVVGMGSGSGCAGADYVDLAIGRLGAVLYWRTLPWDHAPGVLLLEEAGGVARRPDGTCFAAADHARPGLLAARDVQTWDQAHAVHLAG